MFGTVYCDAIDHTVFFFILALNTEDVIYNGNNLILRNYFEVQTESIRVLSFRKCLHGIFHCRALKLIYFGAVLRLLLQV